MHLAAKPCEQWRVAWRWGVVRSVVDPPSSGASAAVGGGVGECFVIQRATHDILLGENGESLCTVESHFYAV